MLYGWPENDNCKLKAVYRDPKWLAREFLRARGVSYKDLITGDHAADLFAEFHAAMIKWNNDANDAIAEHLKYMPTPPFCIKKEDTIAKP